MMEQQQTILLVRKNNINNEMTANFPTGKREFSLHGVDGVTYIK